MSAKTMGQVWDLDIPHNQLIVLLAMTDHADHSGGNMYPSMGLIAHKTGYSERQVKRIIKGLVEVGILILEKIGNGTTNTYRADFSKTAKKKPYKSSDKMSPLDADTRDTAMSQGVGHLDVTPTHDIQMSPEPSVKPSVNHYDDSKVVTMPHAVMEEEKKDTKSKANYYDAAMVLAALFGISELKTKQDKSFYTGIAKALVLAGIPMEEFSQYKKWVEKQSKSQGGWDVTASSLSAKSRPSLYVAKRNAHLAQQANPNNIVVKQQEDTDIAQAHILNALKDAS